MGSMVFKGLLLFFALSFLTVGCSQKVYTVVDVQPEYPGGQAALFKYLGQNIKYPQIRKENGMEGKLYICFTIETDGSVSYTPCEKGNHCADEESIKKMCQSMPKWKPGLMKGKPVRVSYTIPVNIHLE
jgi:periplasmic protein TonB